MPYCPQCATELPANAKFCSACAAPTGPAGSSQPAPAQQVPFYLTVGRGTTKRPAFNKTPIIVLCVVAGFVILMIVSISRNGGFPSTSSSPSSSDDVRWADALNDIGGQTNTAGTVSACHRASGLKPDNSSFAYSQVYARCAKVGVSIP